MKITAKEARELLDKHNSDYANGEEFEKDMYKIYEDIKIEAKSGENSTMILLKGKGSFKSRRIIDELKSNGFDVTEGVDVIKVYWGK